MFDPFFPTRFNKHTAVFEDLLPPQLQSHSTNGSWQSITLVPNHLASGVDVCTSWENQSLSQSFLAKGKKSFLSEGQEYESRRTRGCVSHHVEEAAVQ